MRFLLLVLHCFWFPPQVISLHIVSILDTSGTESCLLKLYSIVQSTAFPQRVRLYSLIMDSSIARSWNDTLFRVFPRIPHEMKLWEHCKPANFPNLTQKHFDKDHIYARFYLPQLFPVGKLIYLDNDIVVNADLTELFQNPLYGDIFASIIPKRYIHKVRDISFYKAIHNGRLIAESGCRHGVRNPPEIHLLSSWSFQQCFCCFQKNFKLCAYHQ